MGPVNRSEKRKWILFLILLSILVFSLYALTERGIKGSSASERVTNGKALIDEVPRVKLLEEKPPPFMKVQRNVFEFREVAPTMAQTAKPIPDAATTAPPRQPQVHYLGYYLEKNTGQLKLAAISNSGRIYVGRVGQVLGGKYLVLQIEDEFVILKYLPENKILRLPLGKSGQLSEEKFPPVADLQ